METYAPHILFLEWIANINICGLANNKVSESPVWPDQIAENGQFLAPPNGRSRHLLFCDVLWAMVLCISTCQLYSIT